MAKKTEKLTPEQKSRRERDRRNMQQVLDRAADELDATLRAPAPAQPRRRRTS
jgi:hypothetical protein